MMSEPYHLHNRVNYPGTLLEAMDLLRKAAAPMSADDVTDALLLIKPDEDRNQLRARVRNALRALHTQGRIVRTERRTEKNFIQYLYACSD